MSLGSKEHSVQPITDVIGKYRKKVGSKTHNNRPCHLPGKSSTHKLDNDLTVSHTDPEISSMILLSLSEAKRDPQNLAHSGSDLMLPDATHGILTTFFLKASGLMSP